MSPMASVERSADPAARSADPVALPDGGSVGTQALRGVPWTVVSFALSRGTQLIGTIVIARLVPPAQIGVVLTGLVVVNTFNLLADNGLSISLVVREERDDRLTATVLTLMVSFALVGVAIAVSLAHPISGLFGSPKLAEVLPLLSLTIVTSTIVWLITNLLQREMLWRQRFAGQFALAVGYVAVAVPCAALGAGLWSMVAGQLAAGLLATAVLWRAYPFPLRFGFDRGLARRALADSRAFVSQSMSSFMIENLHYIAVSAILGPESMALYSMSCRLTELPNRAVAGPVSEAAFPAYVRLRDEPQRRAATLATSLRYVTLATLLPLAALAATAPEFIAVVLGPRWHAADSILVVLCIWGAVTGPSGLLSWFVNANRGARFLASINLVRLFGLGPAIFAAAAVFGSAEVVAGLVTVDAMMVLVPLLVYVHRKLEVSYTQMLRSMALPLAGAAVAVFAGLTLRTALHEMHVGQFGRLVAVAAASCAAYLITVAVLDRNAVAEVRELLGRALSR